jgi:hypothetical protein
MGEDSYEDGRFREYIEIAGRNRPDVLVDAMRGPYDSSPVNPLLLSSLINPLP